MPCEYLLISGSSESLLANRWRCLSVIFEKRSNVFGSLLDSTECVADFFCLKLNEKPVIDLPVLCCSTLTIISVCSFTCFNAMSKTYFLKSYIRLYSVSSTPIFCLKSYIVMRGVFPVLRHAINISYKRTA